MLINTNKFVVAFSIATSISWIICTLMVMFWPVAMTSVTANMMHMEPRAIELTLTAPGFFIGLLGWLVLVAGLGWLVATIYNIIMDKPDKKFKS